MGRLGRPVGYEASLFTAFPPVRATRLLPSPLSSNRRRLWRKSGANFQWHEVNGQHAFLRDEGPRYDPALAYHCYGLVFELFHRRLGSGDLAD